MKESQTFRFRWPVKQVDPTTVEMAIPRGNSGLPILNPEFAEKCGLSDGEIDAAENAVIREVAIIK